MSLLLRHKILHAFYLRSNCSKDSCYREKTFFALFKGFTVDFILLSKEKRHLYTGNCSIAHSNLVNWIVIDNLKSKLDLDLPIHFFHFKPNPSL